MGDTDPTECPTCGESSFETETAMKVHHKIKHDEQIGKYQKREIACQHCGSVETRLLPRDHDQRYCSKACSNQARAGKDGSPARTEILERDDYKCRRCNDRVCSERAETHHILPVSAGGPDVDANMLTLCTDCHKNAYKELKSIHETNPAVIDTLRSIAIAGGD